MIMHLPAIASDPRLIGAYASTTHGIVLVHELHELGFDDQAIHRLVRRGLLIRLNRGVYAVGHRALSQKARWYAAASAFGEDAVLSHVAAGQLLGIDRSRSSRIDVTIPRIRRQRRGIHMHVDPTACKQSIRVDGIPSTDAIQTIVDLAGMYQPARLARVIGEAELHWSISIPDLDAAIDQHRAHPNVARLRDAVDLRRIGSTGAASNLEEGVAAHLCLYPIVQPVPNKAVTTSDGIRRELDFVFPGLGICADVHGEAVHARPRNRKDDAERARALTADGVIYHVIHERAFRSDPAAAVAPLVADVRRMMVTNPPPTNLIA